jgi:phosphopantothenoylcysteine decarboxylase / phosphopantothenate---cysteine ligase
MLKGRKILLGVSGSIAAYKSAFLVRLLIGQGADVRVVMTTSATAFITPLTLSTLSKNEVYSSYFNSETGQWHNHVDLALWADLILVAPATSNTIAKMAKGICDNLLLAVYLSARCPIMIAPAMDKEMNEHASLQSNISQLLSIGNLVLETNSGELASGLKGYGRMLEPEEIVERIVAHFELSKSLEGKKVLVNAGPTYEPIDPVRFIGNRSSGKMGIAIANELFARGAEVNLVLGPCDPKAVHPQINTVNVSTAEQMGIACEELFASCDAAILTAAVSDYKPVDAVTQKIKKEDATSSGLNLKLEETKDILASLGKKKQNQILVGFALETQNEKSNAINKLERKNLDMIVLNSLNDEGAGFGSDTNKITIIERSGAEHVYDLKPKKQVAKDIVDVLSVKLK